MSDLRSLVANRVSARLRYPFWWQFFAWHAVVPRCEALCEGTSSHPEESWSGTRTARVVVVVESDLERGGSEAGAFRERIDLFRSLSCADDVEVVAVHDASLGKRISPEELVQEATDLHATHLAVIDLAAVRGARAGLLRSTRALRRCLDGTGIVPIVVLWDLLNPTFTLGAKWLAGADGHILAMPNTTSEAQRLGLHRATGPCADLIAGTAESADRKEIAFPQRSFDVFLPPAVVGYRSAFVTPIRNAADRAQLSVGGGWFESFDDYIGVMRDSRICVVVNVVKDAYLRGPIPPRVRASFPDTNMVARNMEALSLGSVLLAQDTPALRTYVRPFVDYVPWTTVDEAISRLRWLSAYPEVAERIATNGRKAAEDIIRSRPSWRVLTERRTT